MPTLFTWITAPVTALTEYDIESALGKQGPWTAVPFDSLTPASKTAFANLTTHWLALEAWASKYGGVVQAMPSTKPQYLFWLSYRDSWGAGKPDVTKTQAATADLYNVEKNAETLGYKNPFDGNPVKAPAIDEASTSLAAAAAIDAAIPKIPPLPPVKIPWWAYPVAAGAAIVTVGMGVLILRNSPQARIARAL